ncbi:RepB family plasmid replication initiator protein [uncultured Helcococcus sp.]|nr:RepB family plasmid replication initiator protein [uncultured Helcococcus sp.]
MVNKLTANFTVYELAEFTSLRSTYAKAMYRILIFYTLENLILNFLNY